MTITLTIQPWLPIAYLAIGLALYPLLEVVAWGSINRHDREPFLRGWWHGFRRRPYVPVLVIMLWPVALWEEARPRVRARRRRQ